MINSPRRRLTRDERKALILGQARRIFAEKGYASTSISELVAATGVSQGLLYVYFPSKEALFAESVQASFERINSALACLERMPMFARDKIILALTRIISGFENDLASRENALLVARACLAEGVPSGAKDLILSEQRRSCAALARILIQGQEEGAVRESAIEDLVDLLWITMRGLAIDQATHGSEFRSPGVQTIARMFFR